MIFVSAESRRPVRREREPVRQFLGDWLSWARGHLAPHGQGGHRLGRGGRRRHVLVQEEHRGGCLLVLSGVLHAANSHASYPAAAAFTRTPCTEAEKAAAIYF